jgi:hypothetical protein
VFVFCLERYPKIDKKKKNSRFKRENILSFFFSTRKIVKRILMDDPIGLAIDENFYFW